MVSCITTVIALDIPVADGELTNIKPNSPNWNSTLYMKANAIRRHALTAIHSAGSGHPGGSLSCADILAFLFEHIGPDDKFVMSKGHAAPALYGALVENGDLEEKELLNLRKLGAKCQGHVDKNWLTQVHVCTGSLGQGFGVAIGMALAKKKLGKGNVYVLLGDGEIQEGMVWEGAMFSAHHHLDNLCAIVDYNKIQGDGWVQNQMGVEPLWEKWEAFGWISEQIDGHCHKTIQHIFEYLEDRKHREQKPGCIIAHTIKGKGVSFMENRLEWHGSCGLTDEEYKKALEEL